jgi:hypothetical protein
MNEHHYIVCPCCGIGHGRNFLKDPDPLWIHCDECAELHKIDRSKLPIDAPIRWHPLVEHRWAGLVKV